MEQPVNLIAKFHGPAAAAVRKLVRDYSGGSLLPDPGPGSIEMSYRLDRDLVRKKAALAGEWSLAGFLRRLLWTHSQECHKAMPTLAPSVPARPVVVQPNASAVTLPKGNGRIELDAEQARVALVRIGACQAPQMSSHYFLAGSTLTREEGGKVLQSWEVPK